MELVSHTRLLVSFHDPTKMHWDDLLRGISKTATEQSAAVMQSQGSDFSKEIQDQLQKLMER